MWEGEVRKKEESLERRMGEGNGREEVKLAPNKVVDNGYNWRLTRQLIMVKTGA